MATKIFTLNNFIRFKNLPKYYNYSSDQVIFNQPQSTQSTPSSEPQISGNVPGLSSSVVDIPKEPVGPGASKDSNYKNPEYFCYHVDTYTEAEVEMAKYRLPQPSSIPNN